MLTSVIVDDEIHNRESLRKTLMEHCPGVEIKGEAGNVSDALVLIKQTNPQLVFLDIEMPGESGFDLLRKAETLNFKTIFVSAHSHYAIKAIRFSAVDYLLKPVDTDDLLEAVRRAEKETNFKHQHYNKALLENLDNQNEHKLAVPVKDGLAFLSPLQIVRLQADGTYTHIFSNGEKYTATKNIKEYENLLTDQHFFRSHNSHLINLRHVKKFSRVEGYFAQMSDGSVAEISRRKKEEFIEAMKSY